MSSRDTILFNVRTSCAQIPQAARPAVPEVWPRENPSPAAMAERFSEELTAVQGEVVRCATMDDARRQLAELVQQAGWTSVACMDRPMVRDAAGAIPSEQVAWSTPDWEPRRIADFSVSILSPDVLLADTGSCMIDCPTQVDRLLCYLPPACVIIAKTEQLVEHLPAAWPAIAKRIAEPDRRGEFVFVTGPSRTADIEKILILGVHGPKRAVVLLVG